MKIIKKLKRHLSLIVSFALIISLVSSLDFKVSADDTATKSINITPSNGTLNNIQIDFDDTNGYNIKITATTNIFGAVLYPIIKEFEDQNIVYDEQENQDFIDATNAAKDIIKDDTKATITQEIRFAMYNDSDPDKYASGFIIDHDGYSDVDLTFKGTSTVVGNYTITEDTVNNEYVLTFKYYDYALWTAPDLIEFDFFVTFGGNKEGTPLYSLSENNSIIGVSRCDDTIPTGGDPADKEEFVLTKTALEHSKDNLSITYQIDVEAPEGKSLAGLTLVDKGSFDSVNDYNKFNLERVTKNGTKLNENDEYKNDNDVFVYDFKPSDPPETTATFTLEYFLSDDILDDFFTDGINIKNVQNTADLFDNQISTTKPIKSVTTDYVQFETKYIGKDCKPDPNNPAILYWTIDINASFSHMVDAYLVDYISSKNQKYFGDIEVIFTPSAQGSTSIQKKVIPISENVEKFNPMEVTEENASSYTNKLLQGTKEAIDPNTDSPIIVPIDGFVIPLETHTDNGNAIGGKYEIKYKTLITDTDDNRNVLEGTESVSENDAFVVYKYLYLGPGSSEKEYIADIKINKSHDVTYNVFSKNFDKYDPKTQMITWEFDINRFAVAYDYIMIKDKIEPTIYEFPQSIKSKSPITVNVYKKGSGDISATRTLVYKESDTVDLNEPKNNLFGNDFYTVDNNIIYYYFDGIEKEEYYKFTLDLKVVDTKFLAQEYDGKTEKTSYELTNIASASVRVNGVTDESKFKGKIAKTYLSNELLNKEQNGYDYSDYTSKWRITVNPNTIPIEGLTITDYFPLGTSFRSIDSITWGNDPSTQITTAPEGSADIGSKKVSWKVFDGTETDGTSPVEYNKDKMVFKFFEYETDVSNEQIIINLTLVTDDDYRTDKMGNGKTQLINKAELTGKIYDDDLSVSKTATITPNYKRVTKSAPKITGNTTQITWTAYINTDKIDMNGKTIFDNLKNNDFLEMDITTPVKFYKASVASNNTCTYNTTSEDDITGDFTVSLGYDGFKTTIPEKYRYETFAIVFTTNITKNAKSYFNTLNLYDVEDEPSYFDSSEVETQNFDYSSSCKASVRPKILITKVNTDGSRNLQGAKFEVKFTLSSTLFVSSRTTDNLGETSFNNLPTNTIIELSETAPPPGFIQSDEVKYYVFLASGTSEDDFKLTTEYLIHSNKGSIVFIDYDIFPNCATYSKG